MPDSPLSRAAWEPIPDLRWRRQDFQPGERVTIAVSGGADSVALLLAMAASRTETGLVLSSVHVHHGLRGAEADDDAAFVASLAVRLEVPLRTERGDVGMLAAERGKGIEEAARTLRYRVFHALLASREVDAVATAHTLDDQAETVLMKMLRGAWTEGLGGIAPVMQAPGGGRIVRPLLAVRRTEVVAYLEAAGQPWREDSTNQARTFTRNRIRHTLLPQLKEFQPRIAEQMARMAAVARDEESWWQRELARVLPGLVLPGKPVRGGGRANSTQPGEASVAMELERLRALPPAMQRRVLRAAAAQLDGTLGFEQAEALLSLASATDRRGGKSGRLELGSGLIAERTARELRLSQAAAPTEAQHVEERIVPVPGTLDAVEYGVRFHVEGALSEDKTLLLRTPRAGDRVRQRHSRGDKAVKEILERRGLSAAERRGWPVLAIGSSIVWMREVDVEGPVGLQIAVESLSTSSSEVPKTVAALDVSGDTP